MGVENNECVIATTWIKQNLMLALMLYLINSSLKGLS